MGTQAVAASHGGGGGGGGGRQKAQGLQGYSAQSPIYGFDEFLHTAIPPSTVAGGAEMTLEGFLMKVRATAVDGGGDNGGNLGRGAVSGGYVGRAGPAQQLPEAAPQTLTRKRGAGTVAAAVEEVVEKTVERRQKRMIKNRESAARSRARKQAYTNELENKISRLEEENERLKRQKELEPVIHFVPQPEPKHPLRRTSSALF